MSEKENPSTSKRPLSNAAKYTLLFASWVFLSTISFYLGMNLIQNDGTALVLKDTAKVGNANPSVVEASTPSLGTPSEMETKENGENQTTTENPEESVELPGFVPDDNVSFRSSAWSTDWTAMKKTVHLYNEIHPFIYTMKGGLSNNGELISSWSSTSRKERVQELRVLNPKVKIIPTIFRWENPKEKIQENIGMGGRNDIRDHHIQVIVNEIMTYGYDGIDIDYEGMSCDKKEKFEEFFVLLAREVHKKGKLISVAVHPKTPAEKSKKKELQCRGLSKPIALDFRENWRGPTTHDYAFLAKHADRVKIMAYELHPRKYHNPGPGPQAPNVWLKDIITYAKKRVPTHKLYMVLLPSAEPMFFGKFLKTWGIEVQAFASGPYKSFAESFTRGEFSKEAKKNLETLILDLRKVLLSALTNGQKSLESLFYRPMLSADELLSAGVITGIKSENEFFSEDRKLFSGNYPSLHHSIKEFRIFPKRKVEVVILPLEGGITGGDYLHKNRENGKIEAFSLIPNLKALAEDKKIKAVILEISSPGGSAFYSEQIHQEIMELKKTKIVTAYFKDTVASGGYYLGSAADHITASPVCITGSIGAVSIRANLQKLYRKFQLNKEAVGFYPFRDIHSEFQPLSKQSVQYLESQIKKIEGLFYRRVSEGRKIPLEEVPKIGMGRVYLPTVENKIVDSLGGLLDAVHEVKERLGGKPIILTEELPAYNLKNKIPLLGGLLTELKLLESLNEVSLLSPVRLVWKNRK